MAKGKKQHNNIDNFFSSFSKYKIDNSGGIWNASISFSVKIPNKHIYWIEDMTLHWDKFTPFKNSLFR